MKIRKSLLILLISIYLIESIKTEEVFSIVLIADIHYAYTSSKADFIKRLKSAVEWTNENIYIENIKLVGILGDIAWGTVENIINIKNELNKLKVPYVPVIGNNDINKWPDKGKTFNEIFSSTYEELATKLQKWDKSSVPILNPETNKLMYLQNYAFDLNGLRVICSDWNSREFGNVGGSLADDLVEHQGHLYDFPGGSWPFFTTQVKENSYSGRKYNNILAFSHIAMHHSLLYPAIKTDIIGFSIPKFEKIKQFTRKYRDYFAINFAGHFHYPMHQYIMDGGYDIIIQYSLKPESQYLFYKPRIGLVKVTPTPDKFKFQYKYVLIPYDSV